jgi:serine/threonine protein kinase
LPRALVEKSLEIKKYFNLTRLEIKPTNSLKNHLLSSRQGEEGQIVLLDKFVDFISRCLVYEPSHRISPQDALNHPFLNVFRQSEKCEVPWPSFYTTIFLSHKQNSKPKQSNKGLRSNSIISNKSLISNQSTAVSRNSPRVTSSDEDLAHPERPGSCVKSEAEILANDLKSVN